MEQVLSLTKQRRVRHHLALFNETFDYYQKNCTRSNGADIIDRLHILRDAIYQDIRMLTDTFIKVMKDYPNLVRLNENKFDYIFFGDLHGSLIDLIYLRQLYWHDIEKLQQFHFVFLGDYVDRGIHGFEIVIYLILLKLIYPNNFTILRGNHEVRWLNQSFFLRECELKFGNRKGSHVWRILNQCFTELPYAALINGNIFACHGGIPRNLNSLQDIDNKIPKGLIDEHDNFLALQLLWNDFRTKETDLLFDYLNDVEDIPNDEEQTQIDNYDLDDDDDTSREIAKYYVPNITRRIGYIVGNKAVLHFQQKHKIDYIIRAHQYDRIVSRQGYNVHALNHVITLFSNSNYVGGFNSTACVQVSISDNKVHIIALRNQDDHSFNDNDMIEYEELADIQS